MKATTIWSSYAIMEYFTSKIKFLANGILDKWKALKVLLDMLCLPHSITQIINSFISLREEQGSLIDFW